MVLSYPVGDPEGPGPGMLGKPGCKWFRFGFGRSILAGTENGSVIGIGIDGTVMAVGIAGGGWIGPDVAVDVKAGLTAGIIGIVGGGYAGGLTLGGGGGAGGAGGGAGGAPCEP